MKSRRRRIGARRWPTGNSSSRHNPRYRDDLGHPILGLRLVACTQAVCLVEGRSAHEIFGSPDDLKFRSSMTLFAAAAGDNGIFEEALRKYFDGRADDSLNALR
ncbi:DUF1810 family protein [Methylocapsa sp. S129]|uniref:DUF1810 family protein n=1 Tax=Methylocapsa sp. S129 TaxID=1641869 RepID=UPI00131C20E8